MKKVLPKQLDAFFHIDRDENKVELIHTQQGDLDDFIENLTEQIIENDRSRHFKFKSGYKEVISLLNHILIDKDITEMFYHYTEAIANRLLETEIETQARQGDFNELQKGSLIISRFKSSYQENILISKVEHEDFLDSSVFKKLSGLPYEKGTLKTCLIQFDDETYEVINVIVTDTNPTISKYWTDSFLELEELKSDEKNTKTSFNAIDQFLNRNIRRQSPNDYTMVRNHLITYYRSQKHYDFDKMVETVFGDYTPDNPDINIENLKERVQELPQKKNFDKVFTVTPKEIKARIRKTHFVNSVSELRIIGGSENLSHLIQAVIINGEKYIQLKVENEDVYTLFNFNQNEDE